MSETVISPLIHSPDEHSIVAIPDSESIQKIVTIQSKLKSLLGDAIWLTPPNALHSTLMEIICNTEYTGLTRKEHFMHWYERYNGITRETIAQFPPIDVNFNELYISPVAIILKAADSRSFNAIREALLENTVLPKQTKLPPDITHCTIARYNVKIDLDDMRGKVREISTDFNLHISEFKLMKDLGPDFHPTSLQTYSLGT
jgi:2'-5' RNA ligase